MKTILIVDDHPDIRRMLHATFNRQFEVVMAKDGPTAIDAIRQCQPHLVLLDVMMPGAVDGLQVLDHIKSNPNTRDTVVAVLSARGQLEDQQLAKEKGADAYFVKPFSPLQLLSWARGKLV